MGKHRKIRLEGKRIVLRTLTREDAEQIQRVANDSEIGKYTPLPHPFSLADAYKLVDGSRAQVNKGKAFFLGIELSQEIVGMAGLLKVNRLEQSAEIGYWIGKSYRGKGMASEAVELVLPFGFKEENLQKIWGRVTEDNLSSVRILEKKGFRLIERIPEAREIEGRKVADLVYSLTDREYFK